MTITNILYVFKIHEHYIVLDDLVLSYLIKIILGCVIFKAL